MSKQQISAKSLYQQHSAMHG